MRTGMAPAWLEVNRRDGPSCVAKPLEPDARFLRSLAMTGDRDRNALARAFHFDVAHRSAAIATVALGVFVLLCAPAQASLTIRVDKSTQRLTVSRDGEVLDQWPVSTGGPGYHTPSGIYAPERLARDWHSREYHDAPMPYSIFFNHGIAIHGSYETAYLGEPASHGCVRLLPKHAKVLFAMVRDEGPRDTKIIVSGRTPSARRYRYAQQPSQQYAEQQDDAQPQQGAYGQESQAYAPNPQRAYPDDRQQAYAEDQQQVYAENQQRDGAAVPERDDAERFLLNPFSFLFGPAP